MQLYALLFGGILPFLLPDADNGVRGQRHLAFEPVEYRLRLDHQPVADVDAVEKGLRFVGLERAGHADGAIVIGHVEADDLEVALGKGAVVDGEDLSHNGHADEIQVELVYRRNLLLERLAENQLFALLRGIRAAPEGRFIGILPLRFRCGNPGRFPYNGVLLRAFAARRGLKCLLERFRIDLRAAAE
ncbi:hypothetical protein SDC9_194548 [bioreactor metagenome]|uniref:Uncharacterized protein n=1 Tax=bioreactor metagenome TaxID=1076179 RepID=A0A645I947_9ZZZZ